MLWKITLRLLIYQAQVIVLKSLQISMNVFMLTVQGLPPPDVQSGPRPSDQMDY